VSGFLITADATKPAPEFRSLLRSLANPAPYRPDDDDRYKDAVDLIRWAFRGAVNGEPKPTPRASCCACHEARLLNSDGECVHCAAFLDHIHGENA
jgi:hypothetical protein